MEHRANSDPAVPASWPGVVLAVAGLVGLISMVVLLGWITGERYLRSLVPGRAWMSPWTAVLLLMAAVGLILVRRRESRTRLESRLAAAALGSFVLLFGALTCTYYAWGVGAGIDQLLFGDQVRAVGLRNEGWPALNTAVGLLFAGTALLALAAGATVLAQWTGLLLGLFSVLTLVGYSYGVEQLYQVAALTPLSLPTAVAFPLLAVGIGAAMPGQWLVGLVRGRDSGAIMARRLLPACVGIPFLLGWLRLQGEHAGWYGPTFGVALMAVGTMVALTVLVVWTGRALGALDEERRLVAESRARLIRGFSHDLKNPLGAADGYLQMIEEQMGGEITERHREHLGKARRALRNGVGLIEDLVKLEHAKSGLLEVRASSVDLRAVAEEVTEDYRAAAEAKGLRLELEVVTPVSLIVSDVDRIRQVLQNLVSNAVKYTRSGTITVRVGEREGGASLYVAVEDTGPGIPSDKVPLLFQEFVRFDASEEKGFGLGLAISHRIAEAIGGRVEVESEEGKGATFRLILSHEVEEQRQVKRA